MDKNTIFKLIQKYFPKAEWQNAMAVVRGESNFKPNAVGDNYPIRGLLAPSYGLFQIRGLKGRPNAKKLLDPEFNIKYAAQLFKAQGWSPWTVARKLGLVGQQKTFARPQSTQQLPTMGYQSKQTPQMPSAQPKRIPYMPISPVPQIEWPTRKRTNYQQEQTKIPVPSIASRYL